MDTFSNFLFKEKMFFTKLHGVFNVKAAKQLRSAPKLKSPVRENRKVLR